MNEPALDCFSPEQSVAGSFVPQRGGPKRTADASLPASDLHLDGLQPSCQPHRPG
jgi:hypothetical protein